MDPLTPAERRVLTAAIENEVSRIEGDLRKHTSTHLSCSHCNSRARTHAHERLRSLSSAAEKIGVTVDSDWVYAVM